MSEVKRYKDFFGSKCIKETSNCLYNQRGNSSKMPFKAVKVKSEDIWGDN